MTDAFLDKAEDAIMKLLREVRPTLMESFGKIEHDVKTDNTVVTDLDKSLEVSLRKVLSDLDPSIGIEGEELGIEGSRDIYWLVDPIDGTEQFIRGIPTCRNLMALIENDETVWALMYMFATDELWLARKGQGTTCNGRKVTMKYRPLNRCWVDISINFLRPEIVESIVRTRSHIAGYTVFRDSTHTMSGKTDGAISYGSGGGPWDYAPRALLYQEAGAKVANIGSEKYDFKNNDYLVAHPDNFGELMRLVTGKVSST